MEEDVNKRNKNDFVLWFTKSKFEDQALKWDSPWGVGDVYKRQALASPRSSPSTPRLKIPT